MKWPSLLVDNMASPFSCHDEFVSALDEVDILLAVAEGHQRKPQEYAIFNKACLLFLVAKFEVFLEEAVAEYTFRLQQLKLPATHFPDVIKLHSARYLIDDQFMTALDNLKPSAAEKLKEVSLLWHSDRQIDSIKIDNRFNYGKHGQNAIVGLFARIGIEDVFELCQVCEAEESLTGDPETSRPVDVVADINSMTGIRNNILHNDVTPNLTHWQILEYRRHLVLFADKLVQILEESLAALLRCSAIETKAVSP